MNEFATNYNRTICSKIDMEEAMLRNLKDELVRFSQNTHTDFTDYDKNSIEYSIKKTDEAIDCLHQSFLNLKRLLG